MKKYILKAFFLTAFPSTQKNVQKSMLLHWCCPLISRNKLEKCLQFLPLFFEVVNPLGITRGIQNNMTFQAK